MPLHIAAKVPRAERGYFKEQLEPQIDGEQVQLTGEVNDEDETAFLAGAAALLFPIDWPEPFGLVMIEAMACGTPVIAFRSGSVPEVIDDGVTGFIVPGEAEAVQRSEGFPNSIGARCECSSRKGLPQSEWRRSISVATRHWFIPVPAKFTPASKNGPSAGGEPRPSSQRVPSGGPARTHNPENCQLFPIRSGFDRRLSPRDFELSCEKARPGTPAQAFLSWVNRLSERHEGNNSRRLRPRSRSGRPKATVLACAPPPHLPATRKRRRFATCSRTEVPC